MINKKEITGFICKDCKKEIAIGACGDHRLQTGHKDFSETTDQISGQGKEK